MARQVNTSILELAEHARNAGLYVSVKSPAGKLPETQALLGIPLDPQLEALFRATNGCTISGLFIYDAHDDADKIVATNIHARDTFDSLPFPREILLFGGQGNMGTELATMPSLADERGCQPVVIVDTTGPPCIMPFASTLNRALELLVEDEITTARGVDMDDGFPFNVAHLVTQDARLMRLLRDGAFDDIGGGMIAEPEWCALLRSE